MDVIGSAALCNDAAPASRFRPEAEWTISGDPTEGHWQRWLRKQAWTCNLHAGVPAPRRDPVRVAATVHGPLHHDHHGAHSVVKGAPERVAAPKPGRRNRLADPRENAARHGQRVLAVARAPVPASMTDLSAEAFPADLTLLGMVGMMDPPRTEATESISDCHRGVSA